MADQATNTITVQTPTANGATFTTIRNLTDDPNSHLAPGAVQWARLDRNSPYFDAVVVGSGSNSVLVYRGTGFTAAGQPTFAPPISYPVGSDPVSVTIQDINGDGIPDMLVANKGSNDVSILFGSYDSNGDWVATPGPRLSSGGSGPIAVAVVNDPKSLGGFDLLVTNGQSGTMTVLPSVGQGFFNDQDPQVLSFPGNPTIVQTLAGGFVVSGSGTIFHFDPSHFAATVQPVFASLPGQQVTFIDTAVLPGVADPALVAARSDGTLSLLEAGANGQLQEVQDISPAGLTDPSELQVVSDENGHLEGYVTNRGDNTPIVFDFNLGAIVPVTVPVTVPTQQVAALTPLNEEALPTVATLATVPDLGPRNPFSEITAPPTEFGSVPVVSVELAALESGQLGEDTGADGLGDGNTPADDLGERERDPQGQDKDAALTEELSGLNETIERGLQEMRDLRDRLLNLDDRPGGMDVRTDALDEVFRQGWPGVEQTFDSGNVMVERGLDALRSATVPIQPAREMVSQATPISDLRCARSPRHCWNPGGRSAAPPAMSCIRGSWGRASPVTPRSAASRRCRMGKLRRIRTRNRMSCL